MWFQLLSKHSQPENQATKSETCVQVQLFHSPPCPSTAYPTGASGARLDQAGSGQLGDLPTLCARSTTTACPLGLLEALLLKSCTWSRHDLTRECLVATQDPKSRAPNVTRVSVPKPALNYTLIHKPQRLNRLEFFWQAERLPGVIFQICFCLSCQIYFLSEYLINVQGNG